MFHFIKFFKQYLYRPSRNKKNLDPKTRFFYLQQFVKDNFTDYSGQSECEALGRACIFSVVVR